MRDAALNKSANFVNLGLSSVYTSDGLGSVFIPTTRIGTPTDGFNWIPSSHSIGEVTADRVSRTGSYQDYNTKTDFETRKENQYFWRQNNSISRPPLDSTPLGTNTTNRTISPIDSIPVETKTSYPTPLIRPTEFPQQNGKSHVPGELDPDPSLSDSLSKKSNLPKDINYSKSIKKKRDKKKKRLKHKKHDASDSSSSDSDSSNVSDYRRKRRK